MSRRPIVVLSLLASTLGGPALPLAPAQTSQRAAAPRTPGAAAVSGLLALDAQLDALARRVAPSVVQVVAAGYTSTPSMLLARGQATGSGVIVDEGGWIVTNASTLRNAKSFQKCDMKSISPYQ